MYNFLLSDLSILEMREVCAMHCSCGSNCYCSGSCTDSIYDESWFDQLDW